MRLRSWAIPGLLSLVLAMSTSALAGGPGGGGGGGEGGGEGGFGKTTNPFVGEWIGGAFINSAIRSDLIFTTDFQFTLVESLYATGEVTAVFTGTSLLGGVGPDGFPVITMFSGGQILLQEEYSPAF